MARKIIAVRQGYPHVLVEIRKDLIDTREGTYQWAGVLVEAIEGIISDRGIDRIEHYKNE